MNIAFSFSNFSMDLKKKIRFLSFKVYCNSWITEICQISDACSCSKFEFETFSCKCLFVLNYIVVKVTLYLHYSCIFWEMESFKMKRLPLSEKYKAVTKNMMFLETQYKLSCYVEIKKKLNLLFYLVRIAQTGSIFWKVPLVISIKISRSL